MPYLSQRRMPKQPAELHVLPGLYWHRITEKSQKQFFEDEWVVGTEVDRMGYRFKGGTQLEFVDREAPFGAGTAPSNGRAAIEHSHDLRKVLDKLRRAPMAGKYVTVCVRMFEKYKIGIVSGIRGVPVDIQEEIYSSEEACEHAIFLKRIANLMNHYG